MNKTKIYIPLIVGSCLAVGTFIGAKLNFQDGGEQIFAKLGRPAPPILGQMHENKLMTAGGIYALDVVAQTAKSINAFEITYNGQLLHSKLATGQFPDAQSIAHKLKEVMDKEQPEAAAQ